MGEGRACWSLGNAYVSMGSPAQALTFAKKHLQISQEVSRAHFPRSLLEPQQPTVFFLVLVPKPFLNTASHEDSSHLYVLGSVVGQPGGGRGRARICFPLRMLVSPVWIPSSNLYGSGPCWVSGMLGVTSWRWTRETEVPLPRDTLGHLSKKPSGPSSIFSPLLLWTVQRHPRET